MLVDGRSPKAGEFFRNLTLGQTFREVATKGKDGYYKGRIAEEIVKGAQVPHIASFLVGCSPIS